MKTGRKYEKGIVITGLMLLSGCGKINYPALSDGAIAFETGTFEDKEQDDSADSILAMKLSSDFIGMLQLTASYEYLCSMDWLKTS